jgi:tetratricopeptide (TPR) repeat protein
MSYSEEKFRDHLKKVVRKSQIDSDRPLTLPELRELALSMGLSDSEWDALLIKADQSLELAKSHLAVKNYLDAVESAEEATSINPYIHDGNAVLAQSYYQLSILEKNEEFLVKAGDYARRELVIDPMDATALHILSAVENLNSEGRYSKKLFRYLGIGGAILLLLFFALSYCNNKASENDVRDIVKNNSEANAGSRANALNNLVLEKERIFKEAVQRRNEFLISWLGSQKSPSSKDGIEAVENFDFKNLSKSEMKIKRSIGTVQSEKAFTMDDETRLEGMENRMAVEKKRWFEAITSFNTQIESYPKGNNGLSKIEFPE